DAAVRPRGMDREELEERIRGAGGRSRSPFRRGAPADDASAAYAAGAEPFVPEPTDRLARAEPEEEAVPEQRIDRFADPIDPPSPLSVRTVLEPADWPDADREFPPPPLRLGNDREEGAGDRAAAGPAYPRARYDADDGGYAGREHAPAERWGGALARAVPADAGHGGGDSGGDDGPDFGGSADDDYPQYPDDGRRRGGTGAMVVIGFVVLGLAALLGGAVLSGVLNTAAPIGAATASPNASASSGATPSATAQGSAQATGSESPSATGSPAASASTGPDNFTAKVQPCASQKMSFKGCAEDGSTISSDQVWVWVGFYKAAYNDVIGVNLVEQATGAAVGDGSIQLGQDNIGCKPDAECTGYLYFTFDQLKPGGYTIKVSRDARQAAQATLTVTS
ncbi:MAG: hypothetical protein M3O93_01785, partial [Chloroflexota bacterium]|nr:hypothetical protein [Chloroflexota bacterium]